jgi:hypothetical protein
MGKLVTWGSGPLDRALNYSSVGDGYDSIVVALACGVARAGQQHPK